MTNNAAPAPASLGDQSDYYSVAVGDTAHKRLLNAYNSLNIAGNPSNWYEAYVLTTSLTKQKFLGDALLKPDVDYDIVDSKASMIFLEIDEFCRKVPSYVLHDYHARQDAVVSLGYCFLYICVDEDSGRDLLESIKKHILSYGPQSASQAAFNNTAKPPLCIPERDAIKPYPGKRLGGDVRAWLSDNYPYGEGKKLLTLGWLEQNDPKAYRALYNQSTKETGPPSDFLPSAAREGDDLLAAYGIDLSTEKGMAAAKRLYGLLGSRLFPRSPRKIL